MEIQIGYIVTYKIKGKGIAVGVVKNINNDVLHISAIGAYAEIDKCHIDDAELITKQYLVDDDEVHHYVDGNNCGKGKTLVTKVVYNLKFCWDCVFPE